MKTSRMLLSFAFLILLIPGVGCGRKPGKGIFVDLDTALDGLTNIVRIAETPRGVGRMVSSYDRSGGNRDWATWADADRDGLVTVLDAEGPGCITRFWMVGGTAAEWAFFVDGEKTARLHMSSDDIFGNAFPFVTPLAGDSGGGRYSFLPVPFEKCIRVAVKPRGLTPDIRAYYHVNYTTYPRGAQVVSFPGALSTSQSNHIERVAAAWRDAPGALRAALNAAGEAQVFHLQPSERAQWLTHEGGGVLRTIAVRLDFAPELTELQKADALRGLTLMLTWDGSAFPSVCVPLGDFFCNAFYARRYASLPLGRLDDGWYVCRWPMPFARGAVGVIENRGKTRVKVEVRSLLERSAAPGGRYFHAAWNMSAASGLPFTVLSANGAGHLVGCFLSAIGMDGSWNILEGDETFRIDGETTPSMHGTGLEDYFNGAWYYTQLFDLPLHGLIEKAPIRTDQYRFHLPDPVAFQTGLQMQFEFGDGNHARGVMSSVAYWYQDAPVKVAEFPVAATARPSDPFEEVAVMAQLFELERAQLWDEARARCLLYAERFANPFRDVLRVRAVGYQARADADFEPASVYAALGVQLKGTPAGTQASDLAWLHQARNRALLGIHVGGNYRLWQDGTEISSGDHPAELRVVRVTMDDGMHEWMVNAAPTRPSSFVALYLMGRRGVVTSAGDWELVDLSALPQDVKVTRDLFVTGAQTVNGRAQLPNMTLWKFVPNAYVGMQSAPQGVNLWVFYKGEPEYKRVIMRMSFAWPPSGADESAPDMPTEVRIEEDQSKSLDKLGR